MDRRYFNTNEVAKYLCLSAHTIKAWVYERKIPSHRFGRRIRFDLREIEEWARKNRNN